MNYKDIRFLHHWREILGGGVPFYNEAQIVSPKFAKSALIQIVFETENKNISAASAAVM